jgi:hypothetical protein
MDEKPKEEDRLDNIKKALYSEEHYWTMNVTEACKWLVEQLEAERAKNKDKD